MFKRLGNNLIRDMKEEMQKVFSGIPDSFPPEEKQQPNEFPEGMVHVGSLKEESRISTGGPDIFGSAYEQLDLPGIFGKGLRQSQVLELLKEIVLCRLQEPVSKRKSVEIMKRQKKREVSFGQSVSDDGQGL